MPGELNNNEVLEQKAAEEKEADQKALEHIQKALDQSSEEESTDKGGDKPAETEEDKGQEPEKKDDAKPDDGGEKPAETEEDKGEKPDKQEEKSPDDKGSADDKVQKMLDAKIFDEFRHDQSLTEAGWAVLMEGIEAMAKEFKSMRETVADVKVLADRQRSEEFSATIDSVFDGLGEELSDAFGKGSVSKLDKAFLDNRNAVLQKAETLILGYQAQGKQVSLEDAIKEAAGLWAAQNFKKPQQQAKPQDRRNQFIQKPSGEKSTLAKGDEAALEFIEKFKKDHNEE